MHSSPATGPVGPSAGKVSTGPIHTLVRYVSRLQKWRWLGVAACLLMMGACAGCSSQASTTGSQSADYAATSAYLHAREQLMRSSVASLPAGRAPMVAFVAHVQAGCGGILSGAPVHLSSLPLREMSAAQQRVELEKAVFIEALNQSVERVQQEAQAAAAERFATSVDSLRWSDPRVTDLVHTYVAIEMQRRHMASLDVCRKLREWASTGYRKVPPPTQPFEPHGALGRKWMRAAAVLGCGKFSPAVPEKVLAALRRYQRAGAQPSTRSIELLEARLILEEARTSLAAKRSLFHAIGLPPWRTRRPRHRARHGSSETRPGGLPGCTGEQELLSHQVTGPVGRQEREALKE